MKDNVLYIGVGGHVVAIEKTSGREIWRTKLPSRGTITTIMHDGPLVFAHSRGHLFGIDSATGSILWKNELPNLGYGYCILSGVAESGGAAATLAAAAATAAAGAVAASSTAASSG